MSREEDLKTLDKNFSRLNVLFKENIERTDEIEKLLAENEVITKRIKAESSEEVRL